MNNQSKIHYKNTSENYVVIHIVIGDGKSLLFSGTHEQCQNYINGIDFRTSEFSSLSVLKPRETLEINITSGDSES